MADYRVLLAQFKTAKAAAGSARSLREAFSAHVAAIKTTKRYRGELTEPLQAFAREEGFAWHEDDRFAWDDSDEDPNLTIDSAGTLLIVFHAAAMQLAEIGLQAFARARGATATVFWDPDPVGTITVTVSKAAGFEKLLDDICADHDCELELVDDEPTRDGRLVIKAGKRRRYAALHSSWGLGDVLIDLGKRAGVSLALEAPAPVAPRPGAERDLALVGPVSDVIDAVRRGLLDTPTVADCLAEGVRLAGSDAAAMFEMNIQNRTLEPLTKAQMRAVAAESHPLRKLAAAWPMSQRDAAMMMAMHANWLKLEAKPPHRWRKVDFLGIELVVYEGKGGRQGNFARRDLRGLTFADRPLVAARFAGALLDAADLSRADLTDASFSRASAIGARFTGATLASVDFTGANLREASFRDADLRGAIWTDAVTDGADFTGAKR